MKSLFLTLLLVGAVFASPASAQRGVEDDPGFVDFAPVRDAFGIEPKIEVNVHGVLLRLVATAARFDDPELADLLDDVRGIFVVGYETKKLRSSALDRQQRLLSRLLENDEWETVIKVNDREEDVRMYVRVSGDRIAGIVVMASENRKADTMFINIVGDISPDQIGRIGKKFRLDSLSDWE